MGISRGEIMLVTEGQYSDYVVVGLFRALRDISDDELEDLRKAHSSPNGFITYSSSAASALTKVGAAEELEFRELWEMTPPG